MEGILPALLFAMNLCQPFSWSIDGGHFLSLVQCWYYVCGLNVHRSYLVWTAFIAMSQRRNQRLLLESVVVLPPHGIQLETRRGLPFMSLSTTRQFIPLAILHDMIINEGLKGWDVRFYLATIQCVGDGGFNLNIVFEVSE